MTASDTDVEEAVDSTESDDKTGGTVYVRKLSPTGAGTASGRLTIPSGAIEELGSEPGEPVAIVARPGSIELRSTEFLFSSLE